MDPTWHEIGGVSESAPRVFKDIHSLFNCHIPTISYVIYALLGFTVVTSQVFLWMAEGYGELDWRTIIVNFPY